jgi:hypothetical protein
VLRPLESWQTLRLKPADLAALAVDKNYYVVSRQVP